MLLLFACAPDDSAEVDPLAGLKLVSEDPQDGPVADLDDTWMSRFDAGDLEFEEARRESQGLGPAYIRSSCAGCHADDGRGPGEVRKMIVPDDAVLDAELLPWGHTERPYVAGGAATPIEVPEHESVLVSVRAPPAVFGRGYLEAVEDAVIRALATEQAEAGRVSGRVNEVDCGVEENPESLFFPCAPGDTVIGRFGLKARIATLDGFAADAYQGDMALTSPLRPTELPNPDGLEDDAFAGVDLTAEQVNLTADYMRLLAIPGRTERSGAERFVEVGCADCHVPTLRTRADWPVPQMAGIDAVVYTDLLVHDMGVEFSDGLTDGLAGPTEWKTAPLMGLRFLKTYLHDGRALSVEEAILLHGAPDSEAFASVTAFDTLPEADRAELLTFVESL